LTEDNLSSTEEGGEQSRKDSSVDEELSQIEKKRTQSQIFRLLALVGVLVVTFFGMRFVGFNVSELYGQFGQFASSLSDFTNPDFVFFSQHSMENGLSGWQGLYRSFTNPSTIPESLAAGGSQVMLSAVFITLVIATVGTVMGIPLALAFGVLGSERVIPFPFNFIFRGLMSTIRSIPALVWILIYVPLAGISPVSAVLAIATDTVGNLGRLFTDELEEIEEGPIEAIDSTGASKPQTVAFGMLSQVSNSFIAWTLYILEINVRIAISLGVLGAGGIGQYIQLQIDLIEYGRAAAGIIMVIFVVISVEMLSSRIRARLRPSEHESTGILETLRSLTDSEKWGWRKKDA
jgi:phosphonate transport system permease protein